MTGSRCWTTQYDKVLLEPKEITHALRRNCAKARSRAVNTLPVIVRSATGCGLGAAYEDVASLWPLALPTDLALLAFATGLVLQARSLPQHDRINLPHERG